MGFFDKANESKSPIGLLRAHIGTFMYYVKMGEQKFKDKEEIHDIFYDMNQTKFLLDQATRGSLYEFKKRIDDVLWDAAVHKYTEDMEKLKAALLKAVDEEHIETAEKTETSEPEEREEEKEEEKGDWKENIKNEMNAAEEEERKRQESSKNQIKEQQKADPRKMTEEDCRELWKLIKNMDVEFKEMKQLADDWFSVNGKKSGCLGMAAFMILIPAGAVFGILSVF